MSMSNISKFIVCFALCYYPEEQWPKSNKYRIGGPCFTNVTLSVYLSVSLSRCVRVCVRPCVRVNLCVCEGE